MSLVEQPPDLPLSSEVAGLFGAGTFYFIIWYRDGTVLERSYNAPPDVPRPQKFLRDTLPHFRTRQVFREAIHCSGLGDCVLAGRAMTDDFVAARRLGWTLLASGGGVLGLCLGVVWWLTTRAIRPIEQISAAASRISQGNLSERVQVADRGDELGRLASVLNSTFSKLESVFARQRQFIADAAHELRTLLAVIISETQTTLARKRSAVEYREVVQADLDTARQMTRLTESLLELARFDAENEPIPRSQLDLAERARACIERLGPLAGQHGIRIYSNLSSAPVFSTPDRLDRIITNLVNNAIVHNKPGGEVRITTFSEVDAAALSVADTGIGIAAADLPHIFDRFYRGTHARPPTERRTGLGLAICKAIVDADRGVIDVASTLDIGTTFTVRLPRSAESVVNRER